MPVQTTVEPLFWNTSIQGTPPFRGHKIWPGKNVHQQQFIQFSSNLRLCYPQLAELFYVGNNTVISPILKLAEVKRHFHVGQLTAVHIIFVFLPH